MCSWGYFKRCRTAGNDFPAGLLTAQLPAGFLCGCGKLSDQLAIVFVELPSVQYSRPLTVRSAGGRIFAFFHRSTVREVTL